MPTYEGTEQFWRDFRRLTPEQKKLFLTAVMKLVYDLKTGTIRPGLRVKDVRGDLGTFEMTWAPTAVRYSAMEMPNTRVTNTSSGNE